jgi:hypothetical protein
MRQYIFHSMDFHWMCTGGRYSKCGAIDGSKQHESQDQVILGAAIDLLVVLSRADDKCAMNRAKCGVDIAPGIHTSSALMLAGSLL